MFDEREDEYLLNILNKLLTNNDICKLLYYNDEDPLINPDLADNEVLMFNKIYPYPFNIDIQENATSFINVFIDNFDMKGNSVYINGDIVFLILCHKSLWKIKGSLRPSKIKNEIFKVFNNQSIGTMGKVKFANGSVFVGNKDYYGYKLRFKITDIDKVN